MSENTVEVESDLRGVVDSLLSSRPDLADPKKLRLFEAMLDRQVAALHSEGDNVLQDVASTDCAPTKASPPSNFMWFVMDLGFGVAPTLFVAATFQKIPLPILPVIAIVGFFASRYLFTADRPEH